MITEEEKEEIINKAIERMLLIIPETIGHLMASKATQHKINQKFYADYPEFKDRKDAVASVVEKIENENHGLSYDEILKKSVPEIRKRIATTNKLDMKVSQNPNRDFKSILSSTSSNGEI
jgi:uncharacterized protein with HEPN domain